MEVITLSLSCIGFLVGYILATRSTEKQIIKYIKSITCNPGSNLPLDKAALVKAGSKSLQDYLINQLNQKEHRKA